MKNPHARIKFTGFLATACFALASAALAVDPPPDGGYPNGNTAEGDNALFTLTTGLGNVALGQNTLFTDTTGGSNVAVGVGALYGNTSGAGNTASGYHTLYSNTNGYGNTATGLAALYSNTTGGGNTATGNAALYYNVNGNDNTAMGTGSLENNTTGADNTALGLDALLFNSTGNSNTGIGDSALQTMTTGSNNIAVGFTAGAVLQTGSNNIDIGNMGGSPSESNKIRIGTTGVQKNAFIAGIFGVTVGTGVPVIVDSTGRLGTITSSARFKDEIQPMDKASEAILALQPVTFRYKHDLDPAGIPQFGLVAEQVDKIDPDLVARDDQGKPYTVRYEAVNAMLLNEFLKEHQKVETLEATVVAQQKGFESQQKQSQAIAARQQNEIAVLTATLKAQAAQIQKVSDQLGVQAPAPRVVANN